jgi:hypothetical protein
MTPRVKLSEPQVAAIRELEQEGQLTAAVVVQAARAKASPLHDLFDWDKTKASEKWWLHRAREIIGSVVIVHQSVEYTIRAPAYVVVGDGAGYHSTVALRSDEARAREALIHALEAASGHLRRAQDLAGPLGLATELDRLLASVCGLQRVARHEAA